MDCRAAGRTWQMDGWMDGQRILDCDAMMGSEAHLDLKRLVELFESELRYQVTHTSYCMIPFYCQLKIKKIYIPVPARLLTIKA